MTDPMVRIQAASASASAPRRVLCGVDMDVRPGAVMCIIGPSGSGKSTLLACINHLERIDAGRMWVDGELVGYRERGGQASTNSPNAAPPSMRARIGMVFQHFNLFPHMTVLRNITVAPIRVKRIAPGPGPPPKP